MPPKRGAPRGRRAASASRTGRVSRLKTVDRPKVEVKDESLEDFNESVNIFIYGNSGAGKTVLIADAPEPTWLTTEKGIVSAKRAGFSGRVWRAPTWDHVEAGIDRADKELTDKDWLLVDSASKMQVLLHRWWLGLQNDDNEARDIDIPQIQDHQKFQNMYKRFIDHLIDAPYNCIFTATTMNHEDPEGENLVLPAITGKGYEISNYVCAQMDMVLYLGIARQDNKKNPTVRRLLSETFPPWFAKDRYHVLPRWLDIEYEEYDTMSWIIDEVMKISPEQRRALKAEEAA